MSDSGAYVWGVPGQIANANLAQTQNNSAQLELLQKQRGLSALHGIDIGNPDSVQKGINALTGLGLTDQAKGITDLAQQRATNTAALPNIQTLQGILGQRLARAQGQQQSSDQSPDQQGLSPDQLQHAQETMQMASDAVGRIKATPQNQRLDAFNAERQKFVDRGLPTQALDAVGNHLSDENFSDESLDALTDHYSSHAENFGNVAGGGAPNSNPSRHPADMYGPGTDFAAGVLNDPLLMDPLTRAGLEQNGFKVGPGIDTAANLTAGQRSVAAAGPQAYNTTTGTNVANFNTLPAVERATQKAAAEGRQAGTTQEIKMDDGSIAYGVFDRSPDGTPYMIKLQSGGGGGESPQPGAPSIAKATGIGGTAGSAVDAAKAFEQYTNGYVGRKANLENLRQAAAGIGTGPQAPFWGKMGQFAAEYGIHTPLAPTADQTANYEEVLKMSQAVAAQQMAQLGLPTTNQGTDMATGATPHDATSPLGIQRLAGILEGNEDYGHATRQAWETWKSQNHTGETYNHWLTGWQGIFDPRVFQAQYMDPAQRAQVVKAVGAKRFNAEEAAAKRLGYLGGQ